MSGISSKGLHFGGVENKYKFNSIEQNSDFEINMYDAFYRNLDPQIGRFWQTDPRPSYYQGLYTAFGNNPVAKNDVLGNRAVTPWRSGFLGLGPKHEARYVGGSWIDSKTRSVINPKNVRSGTSSIMNDYGKVNSISAYSPVTNKINSAVNSVNLISGNGPTTGGSEVNTPNYFADLRAGLANPDIDVYIAKGQSISLSVIEGNKSGQVSTYIGMGHELGHVWDILSSRSLTANFRQIPGLTPRISNTEMNAMFWENVLRADAGMPLRTMYNYDTARGSEQPANINVPTVGSLPLVGKSVQSVTLGSLNMAVIYKFLRIK